MITEDQHWTAKVIKGNRGGSKDFEKRGGGGGGAGGALYVGYRMAKEEKFKFQMV